MRKKTKNIKRLLAALLAAAFTACLPLPAFAQNGPESGQALAEMGASYPAWVEPNGEIPAPHGGWEEELGVSVPGIFSSSANANVPNSMFSQLTKRQKACYNALQSISFEEIMSANRHNVFLNIEGITNTYLRGRVTGGKFVGSDAASTKTYNEISNDLQAAIIAIRYDRPDMLWMDGGVSYGTSIAGFTNTDQVRITSVYFGFAMPYGGQEGTMRTAMLQEAQNIANQANREKDTYNKLKVVHDLLAARCSYSHTQSSAMEKTLIHSAYSAIIPNDRYHPVCDGYSKAFKLVCDLMQIPCLVVSSPTHMWNNVRMDDGLWYNLDLTWDDGNDSKIIYDYFLIGSQTVAGGQAFSQQASHRESNPYKEDGRNVTIQSNWPYPTKNTVAYQYIGEDYPPTRYPDVLRTDWFYDSVEKVSKLGYFQGDSSGNFRPGTTITRAEFAKVMANVLDVNTDFYRGMDSFSDVPTSMWCSGIAAWAKSTGVMTGSGGKFRPNDPITRQEMCTVIDRALDVGGGTGSLSFPDAGKIDSWARDGVLACFTAGLIKGDAQGRFNPKSNTLRRDAATIFARYAEME